MSKRALLLVDIQPDFMPGGNLAVEEGDQVVGVANKLIERGGYDLVVASQDWHPADHGSFVSQHPGTTPIQDTVMLNGIEQIVWPDHCVQGTEGAELHPDLNTDAIAAIFQKGMDKGVDSYSAFRDNNKETLTGLAEYLKAQGITELDVCGLATDVCVQFSALDATELLPGVKVRFIEDASRGVVPENVVKAKENMQAAGIEIVQSKDIVRRPGIEVRGESLCAERCANRECGRGGGC